MTDNKCESCDYYEPMSDERGECRRYPPSVFPQLAQVSGRIQAGVRPSPPQMMRVCMLPVVKAEDFCGEFSCVGALVDEQA